MNTSRQEKDAALYGREISRLDGIQHVPPKAGNGKDRLRQGSTAEQVTKLHAYYGNDRDQGHFSKYA